MTAEVEVGRNESRHRYEAIVDGQVAGFLRYTAKPGQTILVHTEVDPAFEGRGIGSAIARYALEDVRARGDEVVVQCPFVAAYVKRHPEYAA